MSVVLRAAHVTFGAAITLSSILWGMEAVDSFQDREYATAVGESIFSAGGIYLVSYVGLKLYRDDRVR